MPTLTCRRCRTPLTPIYYGQREHPLCSPTDTGWIPPTHGHSPARVRPLRLALELAACGWWILPLSPATKRPLGNCPTCREQHGRAPHPIADCPCIPAGAWCHGVRAATTDPNRIATWWTHQPDAIPGVAAGPSRLVLIDIDAHDDAPPDDLTTGLLPGVDLTTERVPDALWRHDGAIRDGRDTMRLLARVHGGKRPWPTDAAHRPVSVTTPSGGRHLWYQAPADNLRQALSPHSIAWQVDIKAGHSYGVAPGATSAKGRYEVTGGQLDAPGRMPDWLAREIVRVAGRRQHRPRPTQPRPHANPRPGRGPAEYLTTVINRGAAELARMSDGRQRALSALAYQAGGLLDWSGLPRDSVTEQLIAAGTTAGLPHNLATRIVLRSLERGLDTPLPAPTSIRH